MLPRTRCRTRIQMGPTRMTQDLLITACSAYIEPHTRVMAGLVPAIHVFIEARTPATSAGMTDERVIQSDRDAL
jgi:hypothetical protein